MKNKLGEDPEVYKQAQDVNKVNKNKYWLKGYKAAKKGLDRYDNPYRLPPGIHELLRKRTLWDRGWEQKAFSKTKKQLKEIQEKNKVQKKEIERRLKHERKEREEKDKRHKHRHSHKKHKRDADS